MQTYETADERERVILVAVQESFAEDVGESLDELAELCRTAGAEVVGRMIQNRGKIHPATYIGKGKIEEAAALIEETDADGIVCDDELKPVQIRTLQEELGCRVMDRTLVILDIFAKHANTSEGILQVELAQLRDRLSRLSGEYHMSRLGGGIGTRGPGEKKLEVDRRQIRERISLLREELAQLEKHRDLIRGRRSRENVVTAAIVGYTNAGKSTLLNALTGADAAAADRLFATLDPTTRILELPGGQKMLLTDTVGFIRKLPHHLIEAFHSTLEEAKYADLILHVVDASSPQMEKQMHVVYETLEQLGVRDKTVITLLNKQDKVNGAKNLRDGKADVTLKISAKTGEGLPELIRELEHFMERRSILLERVFAYDEAGKIPLIRTQGKLLAEEYRPEGIYIKAYVPTEIYGKVALS